MSKAVLVTGCSTGIGRATAERLARRGWTVYASARRPESIKDLADAGCKLLTLDVADEQSRRAAIAEVEAAEGTVGALVNNAGFSLGGPVGGPVINIQPVPEEKVGKARVHLDLWVDDLAAAVARVQELGGRRTGEMHTEREGTGAVMTDPEGTEFCLVALPPR